MPDPGKKAELALAGLGEKKCSLFLYGCAKKMRDELVDIFPKLAKAGGFELLRGSDKGSKDLVPIEIPKTGYTPEYLKAVVSSAKVYIRPLQNNLDLTEVENEVCPVVSSISRILCSYYGLFLLYSFLLLMLRKSVGIVRRRFPLVASSFISQPA